MVVGQGLHRAQSLPYPSLYLMLVDGQIQVLSLENMTHTVTCPQRLSRVCRIVFLQLMLFKNAVKAGRQTPRSGVVFIGGTHLHGDDAARFVVVRFAGVVPVQRVELRVGLIAEGFAPHCAEVKMEAVHQEVNFDPCSPGLWTHRWSGTYDEGGAVDGTARLILEGRIEKNEFTEKKPPLAEFYN